MGKKKERGERDDAALMVAYWRRDGANEIANEIMEEAAKAVRQAPWSRYARGFFDGMAAAAAARMIQAGTGSETEALLEAIARAYGVPFRG